jgi:PEP-CTERM motif
LIGPVKSFENNGNSLNKNMNKIIKATIAAALLSSVAARAQVYTVSIDTSALSPVGANAPFSLDFQLNDGSGTASGNTSVAVSPVVFTGGAATGSPTLSGGASGSLGSGLSLNETAPFSEAFQGFTPGTALTFTVTVTPNNAVTGAPDLFAFSVLDKNLANLPTANNDTIVAFAVDQNGVAITTANTTGSDIVTVVSVVPEPSATAFAGAGLAAAFAAWRVRQSRRG